MSTNNKTSAVFCALHDQLASLGRHAQLTRCFSAVAELLVHPRVVMPLTTDSLSNRKMTLYSLGINTTYTLHSERELHLFMSVKLYPTLFGMKIPKQS